MGHPDHRHSSIIDRAPLHAPMGRALPVSFFDRPADQVAPDLVGKILWRDGVGGGRLTEVEAYLPVDDPACHASRGQTRRNRSMFGPPGTIYVYLSYGIHVLLNLVCESEGIGAAVLVRSFQPLGDIDRLVANRLAASRDRQTHPTAVEGWLLSCGPGRVGQALGLELGLDGKALGASSGIHILDDGDRPPLAHDVRIGISKGDHLPLRFFAAGSEYVTRRSTTSGGKRHETA